MFSYILRRALYAIPVLLGVNLLTFLLFFMVNSPTDMARIYLGGKYATAEAIEHWQHSYGYDKPLFYNNNEQGLRKITNTLFVTKSLRLFSFDFGVSQRGRDIGQDISQRMWPSLGLAIPTLLLGLWINISLALAMVFFRRSYFDLISVGVCVGLMSISGLFYIIAGQYVIAILEKLTPISGYAPGWSASKFLILPIVVGVFAGLGSGARWYRAIFLEEAEKDYVRTARAKGLSNFVILFRHIFKNGLIPIMTTVVVIIPSLFLGSLIMESFFGIPGLGSYTIIAIQQQDFEIVRAMVFLGTLLYILGLLLTDISYILVDPRVRLQGRKTL